MAQTSRRTMLARGATALLAGAAIACQARGAPASPGLALPPPAAAGNDAELIRLLETLKQQNEIIAAIVEEGHSLPDGITDASCDQERRLAEALDDLDETVDAIIDTPASTAAGTRAKAEAYKLTILFCVCLEGGNTLENVAERGLLEDRLALSLARDVLARMNVA